MRGDRHVCTYIWGNSASLNWMEQAIFRRIHFLTFDSKIKVCGQTRYMRWIYGDKNHFSKCRSPLVRSILELINPGVRSSYGSWLWKGYFLSPALPPQFTTLLYLPWHTRGLSVWECNIGRQSDVVFIIPTLTVNN